MSSPIRNLLRKLPDSTGVYQFLDSSEQIIYIGKAKNLRKRVQSYFQKSRDQTTKIERLIQSTADLKWIETNSEVEALTTEANLIRKHQPKFNALLRDDKNFLYFKITVNEDFPRILAVRQVEQDGAKYFGPKTNSKSFRNTLQLVQKLFKLRTCNLDIREKLRKIEIIKKTTKFPCVDSHINLCSAPCDNQISREKYAKSVQEALNFLAGNTQKIIRELVKKMQTAAIERKFELAGQLRDKIQSIKDMNTRQLTSTPDLASRDVIGIKVEFSKAYLALLQIRNGQLIDQRNFILKTGECELAEILTAFLVQYFNITTDLPREILLPQEVENSSVLEKWLTKKATQCIKILVPKKGAKEGLLRLAEKNAAAFAVQSKAKFENAIERTVNATIELAKSLKIKKKLKRIEAYDISHFAGDATVGSMVVFLQGEPKNTEYRHFKIRSLDHGQVNDYASLVEVLTRRMSYLISQNSTIKIRIATKKYLPEVKKILTTKLKDKIGLHKNEKMYIALEDKKVVGFFRFIPHDSTHTELASFFIIPEKRRSDVNLQLLEYALKKCPTKKLYLLDNTETEFYERAGFQIVRNIPLVFRSRISSLKKRNHSSLPIQVMVRNKGKSTDFSFSMRPDLIILDGGKGQLSTVLKSVKFPQSVFVVALAKRKEEIFYKNTTGKIEKILLPRDSTELFLVQRIRDEAHRFANSLREKIQDPIYRTKKEQRGRVKLIK